MEPYRDLGTYTGEVAGFEGALGKLVRARWQLRALDERFRTFTEKTPTPLFDEYHAGDGETGSYSFFAGDSGVPKREWGVLIGELVHNLRSALDQTIYAAAAQPSGAHQFPIVSTAGDWPRQRAQRLATVPDEVVDLVEQLQPFHAQPPLTPERNLLALLARLSNADKHRLLHTAVMALVEAQPEFELVQDVAEIRNVHIFYGALTHGAELARLEIVPTGPNPKIRVAGEFGFRIAFTDPLQPGSVLEGAPVLELMTDIWRLVQQTCIRIEFTCKQLRGEV